MHSVDPHTIDCPYCGEPIDVWDDILREGHDVLAAQLLWRRAQDAAWNRVPMRLHSNDRWTGRIVPVATGLHYFAIEGWTDEFATWRRDFLLKRTAGEDVKLEAIEGDHPYSAIQSSKAARQAS